MNHLNNDTRAQVISCLIELCSIRSTVRVTGVSKKAVMRLLADVGTVAAQYQDEVLRNLSTERLQLDELWTFLSCKKRNVTPEIAAKNPHAGDVWLWTALDADSKLMVSWRVGPRDLATAYDFTHDLADRLRNRVQLTTDGEAYFNVVRGAPELDRPDDDAPLHALVERLQPEASEPRSGRGAELLRVQFHQDSPDAARHTGDGRRRHRAAVGSVGPGGASRSG